MDIQPLSLPDLMGEHYTEVLKRLHRELRPQSYLEIGTLHGQSLRLANCPSIAIDPNFSQTELNGIVGTKGLCALYQMTSDRFFEAHDPKAILGRPIDLAFLDGLHLCEFLLRDFANTERFCVRNSIIVVHDCIPVETAIADRIYSEAVLNPARRGWWLGDVWRTLLALKRRRTDLRITVLGAPPTGLACITNLDPASEILGTNYAEIVEEMLSWSINEIGLIKYQEMVKLEPTQVIDTYEKLARKFWL
jgi:hypothetical protein